MNRKIFTIFFITMLCCSIFAIVNVQPVSATDWITVNNDSNLVGDASTQWFPSRWSYPQNENVYLTMTMDNGATTRMDSTAGVGIWDCAAFGQWVSVPATATQRVSFSVNSYYENTAGNSLFDIFFEVWLTFDSPVGNQGLTGGELLIAQRVIANGQSPQPQDSYQYSTDQGWYFMEYRATDIAYNTWTACGPYDMSALLNQLASYYNIDLSHGTVSAITFGVEGNADNGGMGAQWDYVNYQMENQRHITIVGSEGGTTDPGPGTYTTSGYPQITAYPWEGWSFTAWQITVDGNTWTEPPWNPVDVIYDYATIQPIFTPNFDARHITILASEGGTTDPGPGNHITDGNPHITVYAYPGWTFTAWQITVDGGTWTEPPWNPVDVIYDYATVQPIFEYTG